MSENPARCAPFESDLSAFSDEQLDAQRAGEVRTHLASCTDCTRRLEVLTAVDTALRRVAATPLPVAQSARMRAAIARAKPAHRAPPRRRRWLVPTAVIATAAAAAGLVLVLRPAPVAPPGTEMIEAELAAPKSRAEAEVAARALAAAIDTPIGASEAPSAPAAAVGSPSDLEVVEQLDLLETLGVLDDADASKEIAPSQETSQQERSALRERLAHITSTAPPTERARLEANLARWEALPAAERERLRERWRSFLDLPPAERERLLRERGTQIEADP